MVKEIELEIINLFIKNSIRKSLVGFVESGKRNKVIDAFSDSSIFDERYITEFRGGERTSENLVKQYKSLGMGGRVYVMSGNTDWDEQ